MWIVVYLWIDTGEYRTDGRVYSNRERAQAATEVHQWNGKRVWVVEIHVPD